MNTNSKQRHLDFTTDDGLELRLYPVRLVVIELALQGVKDDLREQGVPVDPPTYTIHLAGDATEEIEHIYDPANNLDTLTVPGDSAQSAVNFAHWRKYQSALIQLAQAEEDCRLQEFFKNGVEFEWPKGIEGWEARLRTESRGKIDPPDDDGSPETDAERKWTWLWFCHLSAFDVQAIRSLLNILAQGRLLSEDQFRQITDTIRSGMVDLIWQALEPVIALHKPRDGEPVVPDA